MIKPLNGQSIMTLDMVDDHHTLVQACGRNPKVVPHNAISLLEEVTPPEMGDRPRVLYSVVRALVPCTNLATHSQCYGVVYYRDLLQYSEKKMLKEVSARGVVHFQKADGVLTPTSSLLLT